MRRIVLNLVFGVHEKPVQVGSKLVGLFRIRGKTLDLIGELPFILTDEQMLAGGGGQGYGGIGLQAFQDGLQVKRGLAGKDQFGSPRDY